MTKFYSPYQPSVTKIPERHKKRKPGIPMEYHSFLTNLKLLT